MSASSSGEDHELFVWGVALPGWLWFSPPRSSAIDGSVSGVLVPWMSPLLARECSGSSMSRSSSGEDHELFVWGVALPGWLWFSPPRSSAIDGSVLGV